jgi:hypothetical protein
MSIPTLHEPLALVEFDLNLERKIRLMRQNTLQCARSSR